MSRGVFVYIILFCLQFCWTQRRIISGKQVLSDKPYVVYLVRSEKSNKHKFNTWLCGGALVSPQHILTSAACLEEVTNMYAIAGYRKYVPSHMLEEDECTRNRKQKVIKTCVPREYKLVHKHPIVWMERDVGFAIVEKPYNFSDRTYHIDCDYTPRPVKINYGPDLDTPNMDAVVFGWGHTGRLRLPGDSGNYNTEYMYEASTMVAQQSECLEKFKQKHMDDIIRKFMICCNGQGVLDGDGENIEFKYASRWNSCPSEFRRRLMGDFSSNECGIIFETRRNGSTTLNITKVYNKIKKMDKRNRLKLRDSVINGRRNVSPGICQNDHGSPLIAWLGPEVYVIGIAATSLLDKFYVCQPPYLFTSTQCVSRFIRCVLSFEGSDTRRACNEMEKEEGLKLRQTDVPWDPPDDESQPNKLHGPRKEHVSHPSKTMDLLTDSALKQAVTRISSSGTNVAFSGIRPQSLVTSSASVTSTTMEASSTSTSAKTTSFDEMTSSTPNDDKASLNEIPLRSSNMPSKDKLFSNAELSTSRLMRIVTDSAFKSLSDGASASPRLVSSSLEKERSKGDDDASMLRSNNNLNVSERSKQTKQL